MSAIRVSSLAGIAFLCGCTYLTPLHQNTARSPHNSLSSGSGYDLAFIEFGEQGSYQDSSQLQNAIELIYHPLPICTRTTKNQSPRKSFLRNKDPAKSSPNHSLRGEVGET